MKDGLGGPAASDAIRHGREHFLTDVREEMPDAVNAFGGSKAKGPKWADVRRRLEDKGVDMNVSDEREQEINDILSSSEYKPLFSRIQETLRQNIICLNPPNHPFFLAETCAVVRSFVFVQQVT